jgi:Uma2 family endonuclease
MHSPVVLRHNIVLKYLLYAIDGFVSDNKLGLVGYEKLMIRLTRNDYEPDLCFFPSEKANGFTPDQKPFPTPEWIAEVLSGSTAKNDRGIKMEDYAAHGVKEYWLVEPEKQFVEQYYLKFGSFFLHKIYSEGEVLQSKVFTGLQLPIDAIFDEDANKQYRKQFF